MKIERKLKYGSFGWDDKVKKFTIKHGEQSIELNKVYAFAFLRFAFSVAQRNWFRKEVKEVKPKAKKEVICDKNIRNEKFKAEQFSLFNEEYKEKHQEVKFDDIPKMPC
jgi:hypothetical protein